MSFDEAAGLSLALSQEQQARDLLLGKRQPARQLPLVPCLARMVVAFDAYDRTPELTTGNRKERAQHEHMRQAVALMQANGTMAPFLGKVAEQLRDRIARDKLVDGTASLEGDELGRPIACNYTAPVAP